jgi:hypothetical protein
MAKKLTKKDMGCNTPVPSWRKNKKLAVRACDKGKEKLLHFGDIRYEDFTMHKDKKRRKNFRKRHRCDSDKPKKLTPRYWACDYLW